MSPRQERLLSLHRTLASTATQFSAALLHGKGHSAVMRINATPAILRAIAEAIEAANSLSDTEESPCHRCAEEYSSAIHTCGKT